MCQYCSRRYSLKDEQMTTIPAGLWYSNKLEFAHKELQRVIPLIVSEFHATMNPKYLIITRVWAHMETQKALHMQGRNPLEVVNAKRKSVGLWPITPKENTYTVTDLLNSKHTLFPSMAVDLAVTLDPDGTGPLKPIVLWKDMSAFRQFGLIAEKYGLVWGGRWKRMDMPHVELPIQIEVKSEVSKKVA